MEDRDSELPNALFSAALSLLGILAPLLAGLLVGYDQFATVSWLEARYNTVIWGVLGALLLTAAVAGISLANLSGHFWVPTRLAVGIMAVLIAASLVGSVAWVLATV
jgi:hypothetical protein